MNLKDKIIIVTGGCGLLGSQYMKAISEAGGIAVSLDINSHSNGNINEIYLTCDITDEQQVSKCAETLKQYSTGKIYGLINNAAIDPKFDASEGKTAKPNLEDYPLDQFQKELNVGLTGALICTKIFGREMIEQKSGSIINISSVLGIQAPNQNFYRNLKKLKPVGYTTVKHAIIGLTRHTATEWATHNVRCNALVLNGVFNNHPASFVSSLTHNIPLGRMAQQDEYNKTVLFLLSDNSKYMTGQNLVIDGGFTIW